MLACFILVLFLSLSIPTLCFPLTSDSHKTEEDFGLQKRTGWLPGDVSIPWPDRKIPFCFYIPPDMIEKDKNGGISQNWRTKMANMRTYVSQALDMWQQPKSANARATYGAVQEEEGWPNPIPLGDYKCPISFEEVGSCPYKDDERNRMLVITLTKEGKEVNTTLGYREKGANHMQIGLDLLKEAREDQIGRYAHELGRAAGLPNENQLYGDSFEIKCKNILGHDTRIKEHGESKLESACKSYTKAWEIGWTEAMQLAPFDERPNFVTLNFDPESIMLLGLRTFGKGNNDVLLARDASNSRQATENVNWMRGPSIPDLVALFRLYDDIRGLNRLADCNQEFIKDFMHQDELEDFEDLPPYPGRVPPYPGDS